MNGFRFLLVPLLLVSSSLFAAPKPSTESAKDVFDQWLAAHNSADRTQLEAFTNRYDEKPDADWLVGFSESTGSLQLLEVRTDTPTKVDVLVLSEWGNAMVATIELKPGVAPKISNMQFEGVPTPEAYKPAAMEWDALVREARRRLDVLEAQDKLSGSFLMSCAGKPAFEWNGGLADREASIPVSSTSRFRMGSLGKMFTAIAILQLADAGRLSLDDTLARHLPDYPNQAVARAITLRQLLNHTGGTGNVFNDDFPKVSASLKTHRDYWKAFASTPLEFQPGTQELYSNTGYLLLGSVVEAVSGQSYYDYVQEHIFGPAGMTFTGAEPEAVPVTGLTHIYARTDGKWVRETATLPWRGTAAGGAYTTTHDMLKFATALQRGKFMSAKSLAAATMAQNLKGWYGYGFMVSGEGRQRQFGHEGGAPGNHAVLKVLPQQGCTIVGLSNFDPGAMGSVASFVTGRLP